MLALVELGCVVMLVVALVWGNMHPGRRYPTFWWTEMEVGKKGKGDEIEAEEKGKRIEETVERTIVLPRDFVLSEEERAVIARLGRIGADNSGRGPAPEVKGVP